MRNLQILLLFMCLAVFAGCTNSPNAFDSLAGIPGGSYQNTCKNCHMEDNCLVCDCDNQGTLVHNKLCKLTGCTKLINSWGNLSCVLPEDLPAGRYSNSCSNCEVQITNDIKCLSCDCRESDHTWADFTTRLCDYDGCKQVIDNIDGALYCG